MSWTMLVPQVEQEHVGKASDIGYAEVYPEYPAGRTCADVDADVRLEVERLGQTGLTRNLTGRGMGSEGHKPPVLDFGDHTVVEPGIVFSMVPGLYVPNVAGFRHSDTAIVTSEGIELATYYPRDLPSLIIV